MRISFRGPWGVKKKRIQVDGVKLDHMPRHDSEDGGSVFGVLLVWNAHNEGEIQFLNEDEGGMLFKWEKDEQKLIELGWVNGKDLNKLLDMNGQREQTVPGPDAKCRLKLCKCGQPVFEGLKMCADCLVQEDAELDRCYAEAGVAGKDYDSPAEMGWVNKNTGRP